MCARSQGRNRNHEKLAQPAGKIYLASGVGRSTFLGPLVKRYPFSPMNKIKNYRSPKQFPTNVKNPPGKSYVDLLYLSLRIEAPQNYKF